MAKGWAGCLTPECAVALQVPEESLSHAAGLLVLHVALRDARASVQDASAVLARAAMERRVCLVTKRPLGVLFWLWKQCSRHRTDRGLQQWCVHPPGVQSHDCDISRKPVCDCPLHSYLQHGMVSDKNLWKTGLYCRVVTNQCCVRELPAQLLSSHAPLWFATLWLQARGCFPPRGHVSPTGLP